MFLDEPTSGLDSHSSLQIMDLIRMISRKKCCTIITTIHQPSSQVFKLFDGLLLLSKGNISSSICMHPCDIHKIAFLGELCYFGPASEAAAFFESHGHPVPPFVNPADHFLDVRHLPQFTVYYR